jgi:hypothetical protein
MSPWQPARRATLLDALSRGGTTGQVTALASRAADVALDDPRGVARLLDALRDCDAEAGRRVD